MGEINVDIRSSKVRLDNLSKEDALYVCLKVFKQLELHIRSDFTEYKGTKLFYQNKIKDIVKDKTLNINLNDYSDQEFGRPMSNPGHENLQLDLSNKNWYVYDEDYGTSEEKNFIQYINGVIDKLKEKFSEIYLIRNHKLFKLFRFSDGKPTEPDFVLFLKEIGDNNWIQYQLFVEAKGTHLLLKDQWKEDFLRGIESNYELHILDEDENYRLLGLPFFNEDKKTEFNNIFSKELGLSNNS